VFPPCSRAAEAERIHAAALEEYRIREAEANRCAQQAAEAKDNKVLGTIYKI